MYGRYRSVHCLLVVPCLVDHIDRMYQPANADAFVMELSQSTCTKIDDLVDYKRIRGDINGIIIILSLTKYLSTTNTTDL